MKKLIIPFIFIAFFLFDGCYTVLLTTENTYEEELERLESGDVPEDVQVDEGWIYAARGEDETYFDYYNIPWWYANSMVSKDIYPLRTSGGDDIITRPNGDVSNGGGATRNSNGGGSTTSGSSNKVKDKKPVTTDGEKSTTNSPDRENKDGKKNLRNDDGNRSNPKRK